MRRMTDKDILKTNAFLIGFAIFCILMSLFLPFLPYIFPNAEYSDLMEKDIMIESVKWIHQYRGASFHRITAKDGERYNITGNYDGVDISEVLYSGRNVTIKWYENRFLFFTRQFAEEIYADGECIVRYNNDDPQNLVPLYIISAVLFAIGLLAGWFVLWHIKHNRRKQQMRDGKIIRKYGSIKHKQ